MQSGQRGFKCGCYRTNGKRNFKIALFAVVFVMFVLIMTTTSWAEPFVILARLGIAVAYNEIACSVIFDDD